MEARLVPRHEPWEENSMKNHFAMIAPIGSPSLASTPGALAATMLEWEIK